MMTNDICVICGATVPEGRQVCPECAERATKKKASPPTQPPKPIPSKKKRRP
ncbi:MAG: hypothetical protein J6W28_05140 [Clostridia bacterium]|nr:hypothetical protein [Clostridia bacterium]